MDNYKIITITMEEAKKRITNYTDALLYMLDGIKLIKIAEQSESIKWEECTEARFFSEEEEMHIFEQEGKMQAVIVKDGENPDVVLKPYILLNRKEKLLVKEYIDYDEDGQMVISLTRLAGITK